MLRWAIGDNLAALGDWLCVGDVLQERPTSWGIFVAFNAGHLMELTGHTFVIAGGGSGLGAGCARRFARHGAQVLLLDINEPAGQAVAKEIGSAARFVRADVTSEADIESALKYAQLEWGRIHGVVNCAGILHAARVVGREGPCDLTAFTRVISINLIGTFNVTRLAASALSKQPPNAGGERGVIINTASVAAYEGQIGQAAYSASKGGVAAMTLPLARELGQRGIRVVAIAPGIFATPMMQAAPAAVRDSLAAQIPFPARFGDPDEYAALAQHIIENAMLNGTVIRLDGAVRMGAK